MNQFKPYVLTIVVALIIGTIYFINSGKVEKTGSLTEVVTITPRVPVEKIQEPGLKIQEKVISDSKPQTTNLLPVPPKSYQLKPKGSSYPLAKEITTPDGFINTDGKPITVNELVGKKIILIDFWTYSCINCQRTTPYLNAWYEKYKDKGLVIIGIHTPEFEFEKKYDNVQAAVEKFGIKFPVVLDNDYSTWTAYKNRYWPRKYLIDIDGYVIYDHIGEGAYEETEKKIQQALSEKMSVLGESGEINQSLTKDISVSSGSKSPETYFGSARNEYFDNGSRNVTGVQKGLIIPSPITSNTLYLSGDWNITDEFSQNISANASIVYRYNGKDVFLVSESSEEAIVEVWLDGKPLGKEAGSDIIKTSDGKTIVKMKEARLYKIIQDSQSETHILEFKILKPGLKAFAFTFG